MGTVLARTTRYGAMALLMAACRETAPPPMPAPPPTPAPIASREAPPHDGGVVAADASTSTGSVVGAPPEKKGYLSLRSEVWEYEGPAEPRVPLAHFTTRALGPLAKISPDDPDPIAVDVGMVAKPSTSKDAAVMPEKLASMIGACALLRDVDRAMKTSILTATLTSAGNGSAATVKFAKPLASVSGERCIESVFTLLLGDDKAPASMTVPIRIQTEPTAHGRHR